MELFLWLKENYENLCLIQRWGRSDVETEFLWSLDEDAGYRAVYLEEAMWGNPLMPEDDLYDESEFCEKTFIMMAIIHNPNCPKSIIEEMSTITEDDREWEDEELVEDLREAALELLAAE